MQHMNIVMSPNGRKKEKTEAKEVIHSGHFMVSEIDDSEVQDGDDESISLAVHESDCDQESPPMPSFRAFNFDSACQETSKTYAFGPRSSLSISIDASLTKLFECMTLAYSGKLTSPRWKQFKGLKLRLKEKIRLNNMIWRAWHMQFIMKIKTFVCQFATPLDGGDMHLKPEAVVIEGTYGKRRSANIKAEYKKWRLFYKEKSKVSPAEFDNMTPMDFDDKWSQRSMDCFNNISSMDESFFMDFTDTLFSTFNPSQPFDFPNPREIAAKAGIADFIQPGLVQLQPSVDDFMDTFEPLQAFLPSFKLPPLPEETSDTANLSDSLSSNLASEVNLYDAAPSENNIFALATSPTSNALKRTFSAKKHSFPQQKINIEPSQQQQQVSSEKLLMDKILNMSSSHMDMPSNNIDITSNNIDISSNNINISTNNIDLSPNTMDITTENIQTSCPVYQNSLQSETLSNNIDLQSSLIPSSSAVDNILQSYIRNNHSLTSNSLLNQNFTSTASNVASIENNLQQQILKPNSNCFSTSRSTILNPATFTLPTKQTSPLFQQPQPQASQVQVPLSCFSRQQQQNISLNTSASSSKNESVPLFLTVDFSSNQNMKQTNATNFRQVDIPVQISNVAIVQPLKEMLKKEENPSLGVVRKHSLKSKSTNENQTIRRHSYTTGQQPQAVFMHHTVDTQMNRRSRRIAPATSSSPPVVNFAVPEIPSRHRTRSRSVSSPQGGSPKPFAQQSSQAVSLTDINLNLAIPTRNQGEKTLMPEVTALVTNAPSSVPTVNVLTQNAVIAQLLSSGRGDFSSKTSISSTNILPTPTSSPVTIIESLPTLGPTTTQTFVLSSVPLTSVSSIGEFQRNILVNAANQVFTSPSTSCFLPSPLSNSGLPTSNSPTSSNASFDSAAAAKNVRLKSDEEKHQYKEHRRVCHINAEQKRRCNIKNGFEALHLLLPPVNQNPNAKVSKAALLQKGAEYIRTLKTERQQQHEEAELLKKQIEALNQAISQYQSQLPASGVPVPCQKTNKTKEMFEEYVRQQTLKNWKFWIFSLILEPLVESYNNNVSTANIDEMCKSILSWLDQHCSLVALRPGVLNSLRHLSTSTNILIDPSCIAEEATRAVTKKETRPKQ